MDKKRFPKIIENIYKNVAELEKMFPGRPFTPDGHMVGSIGECIVVHYYGLNIVPPSNKGYDAVRRNLKVEIKATQAKRISLRSEPHYGEVIHSRDCLLLEKLRQPKSIEDFKGSNLFYKTYPDFPDLIRWFELVHIEKHLMRLKTMGKVRQEDDKWIRA